MKFKSVLSSLILVFMTGNVLADNTQNQIPHETVSNEYNISNNTTGVHTTYSHSAKWMQDFDFDTYRAEFTNISGECRYLIVRVTTSNGYNQLYHHKSQAWDSFSMPYYNDGSQTIAKRAIASISCNKTPPGISW